MPTVPGKRFLRAHLELMPKSFGKGEIQVALSKHQHPIMYNMAFVRAGEKPKVLPRASTSHSSGLAAEGLPREAAEVSG